MAGRSPSLLDDVDDWGLDEGQGLPDTVPEAGAARSAEEEDDSDKVVSIAIPTITNPLEVDGILSKIDDGAARLKRIREIVVTMKRKAEEAAVTARDAQRLALRAAQSELQQESSPRATKKQRRDK